MANIRIEVRGVVRRAAEDLYIARCVDYDVIARGATPTDAAQSLLEIFVSTFEGYRRKGLDLREVHPKAPKELSAIFDRAMFGASMPSATLDKEEFEPRFKLDEAKGREACCA